MARMRVIRTVALLAALGGLLVSYVFPAYYTATATVVAEGQLAVIPVIPGDFEDSVQTLSQETLAPSRLRVVIHAISLGTREDETGLISEIQQNTRIQPMIIESPKQASVSKRMLGLDVIYTDRSAVRAQRICNALASVIMDENLRLSSDLTRSTIDFLPRQVELAKEDLEHKRAQLRAISKARSPRSRKDAAAYKALARDCANAQVFYQNLRARTNESELFIGGVSAPPLGQYVHVVTADVPETPSSPKRLLFSLGGLGAGVLVGIWRAHVTVSKATVDQ